MCVSWFLYLPNLLPHFIGRVPLQNFISTTAISTWQLSLNIRLVHHHYHHLTCHDQFVTQCCSFQVESSRGQWSGRHPLGRILVEQLGARQNTNVIPTGNQVRLGEWNTVSIHYCTTFHLPIGCCCSNNRNRGIASVSASWVADWSSLWWSTPKPWRRQHRHWRLLWWRSCHCRAPRYHKQSWNLIKYQLG